MKWQCFLWFAMFEHLCFILDAAIYSRFCIFICQTLVLVTHSFFFSLSLTFLYFMMHTNIIHRKHPTIWGTFAPVFSSCSNPWADVATWCEIQFKGFRLWPCKSPTQLLIGEELHIVRCRERREARELMARLQEVAFDAALDVPFLPFTYKACNLMTVSLQKVEYTNTQI